MKKFLFILAAVLQVAIAGAQQVDTTGFYSEKRDTLKAAAVTVRRDLVTAVSSNFVSADFRKMRTDSFQKSRTTRFRKIRVVR